MDIFLLFWLIFLIVFVGTLIIVGAINLSSISDACKQQEKINVNAHNILSNSNFNTNKIFYLNDNTTYNKSTDCKKFIAIDNDYKQICLINYEKGNMIIVNFNEILNYEIYENGSNTTTGGTIGGFWSGIFAAETNGNCKDLKLIIRLNRYDTSQISYDIISNTLFNVGINKSTQTYKKCISTLQEIVSFLEVVKKENKNTD